MAQVYAQQAQSQAEMLEATNREGSENSDSEAGPKSKDAYLQEGFERPAKVQDDDESGDSDPEIQHHEVDEQRKSLFSSVSLNFFFS